MERADKIFLESSICKLLYPYAIEAAKNGSFREAERFIRFILDHDSSPEYFVLLGKIYAQQERYGEAVAQWEKALELDPENVEAKAAIKRAENPSKLFYLLSEGFLKNSMFVLLCVLLVASIEMVFSLRTLRNDELVLRTKNNEAAIRYDEMHKQFTAVKTAMKKESDLYDMVNGALSEKGLSNFNIAVVQHDGHISLKGEVPTRYLKETMKTLIAGQAKDIGELDVKDVRVGHRYEVSSGDTLVNIAQRLYGKGIKWSAIFAANRDRIKTPDELPQGISLYIP